MLRMNILVSIMSNASCIIYKAYMRADSFWVKFCDALKQDSSFIGHRLSTSLSENFLIRFKNKLLRWRAIYWIETKLDSCMFQNE